VHAQCVRVHAQCVRVDVQCVRVTGPLSLSAPLSLSLHSLPLWGVGNQPDIGRAVFEDLICLHCLQGLNFRCVCVCVCARAHVWARACSRRGIQGCKKTERRLHTWVPRNRLHTRRVSCVARHLNPNTLGQADREKGGGGGAREEGEREGASESAKREKEAAREGGRPVMMIPIARKRAPRAPQIKVSSPEHVLPAEREPASARARERARMKGRLESAIPHTCHGQAHHTTPHTTDHSGPTHQDARRSGERRKREAQERSAR
jgi:hypothetical protein